MPNEELVAAKKHFECTDLRTNLKDEFVIGRYSVLPFYAEQERDLKNLGCKLINSLQEHSYVADLKNYVEDLKEMTPKTWYNMESVPKDGGPFVLKGATNSKKHDWSRSMFAETWKDALEVQSRLYNDSLIGAQDIYIRQYVPLVTYGKAIGGLPLTKEFRFFIYKGQIISGGFYWDAYREDILEMNGFIPDISDVPEDFLKEAIRRVECNVTFFVMDVGQKVNGEWIVIELNDGCCAGLCGNEPEKFYKKLKSLVRPER
jgi:hypothetical protein